MIVELSKYHGEYTWGVNSSHRSRFSCAPPMASSLHSWEGTACSSSKAMPFQLEHSFKELIPATSNPPAFCRIGTSHRPLHQAVPPHAYTVQLPHWVCWTSLPGTMGRVHLCVVPVLFLFPFDAACTELTWFPMSYIHLLFLCLQPPYHPYYILHNALKYSVLSLEQKIQIHFMLIMPVGWE